MKYSKEQQKYYYDCQCTKELLPLRPGDHVRVKPEPGSKEWKAATVVQQRASPWSYVVDVGGQQIRRNRVALRTDTSRSHAGFWKHHANSIPEPEPDLGNPHVVPTLQASTHIKLTAQDHHPDPPAAQENLTQGVIPSFGEADAKDSAQYTTRSGQQVKKPVKLEL